jgi:hypothetical protein
MKKHEVLRRVLEGKNPPYVPWSFKFALEPKLELRNHYHVDDLDEVLGNHILQLGSDIGFFDHLGGDLHRDVFGFTWDSQIGQWFRGLGIAPSGGISLHRLVWQSHRLPRVFQSVPA